MLEKPWWEVWPGVLKREIDALQSARIPFIIDNGAKTNGQLVLHLKVKHPAEDRMLPMRAIFPPLYPYFRPVVLANPGEFKRHQNPINGDLCLLGRRTDSWDCDETLANLLTKQLPELVKAAQTESVELRRTLEVPMGEPVTLYYQYQPNSIITSGCREDIEAPGGSLTLAFARQDPSKSLIGQIVKISDKNGRKLYQVEINVRGLEIPGRWQRVKALPTDAIPSEFERQILQNYPNLKPKFEHVIDGWFVDVVGIVIAEESQQDKFSDGWMFMVRLKQVNGRQGTRSLLVRGGRAGREDFDIRIPELNFLHTKTVALVGLGSLGSPIAVELARCGIGKLTLVEFDFVEPGSTVRWVLGASAWGLQKTFALEKFISHNYARTRVNGLDYRIGDQNLGLESEFLRAMAESDIIVDATAEGAVHHFLSDFSREKRKPFVYSYLTPGGIGGLVARFDPLRNMGCWYCLQIALYESGSIPQPAFIEAATLQPPGCGETTATFANFDAGEVAMETCRMIVSTLGKGEEKNFPEAEWDVETVGLREATGKRIPPSWKTFKLPKNLECHCAK